MASQTDEFVTVNHEDMTTTDEVEIPPEPQHQRLMVIGIGGSPNRAGQQGVGGSSNPQGRLTSLCEELAALKEELIQRQRDKPESRQIREGSGAPKITRRPKSRQGHKIRSNGRQDHHRRHKTPRERRPKQPESRQTVKAPKVEGRLTIQSSESRQAHKSRRSNGRHDHKTPKPAVLSKTPRRPTTLDFLKSPRRPKSPDDSNGRQDQRPTAPVPSEGRQDNQRRSKSRRTQRRSKSRQMATLTGAKSKSKGSKSRRSAKRSKSRPTQRPTKSRRSHKSPESRLTQRLSNSRPSATRRGAKSVSQGPEGRRMFHPGIFSRFRGELNEWRKAENLPRATGNEAARLWNRLTDAQKDPFDRKRPKKRPPGPSAAIRNLQAQLKKR